MLRGLVGRVVEHLDFEPLARVLDAADRVDQAVRHVHLVVERQLDRDDRQRIGQRARLRLPVLVPHVEIHEVIPMPAVDREDDQDEKIRGEREGFVDAHVLALQSFILLLGPNGVKQMARRSARTGGARRGRRRRRARRSWRRCFELVRSRISGSPASIITAASVRGFPRSSSASARRRIRLRRSPAKSSAAARRCSSRARARSRSTPCAPSCRRRRTTPQAVADHVSSERRRARQGHDRRRVGGHVRSAGRRGSRADRRVDGQHGRAHLRRRRRRAPPAARRAPPPRGRARHHRRRGHGRRAAERRRRAWSRVPVIAVPTSVGYGASFGGHRGAARHAQQLRVRRVGRQHRQRLRSSQYRQSDQSLVGLRAEG